MIIWVEIFGSGAPLSKKFLDAKKCSEFYMIKELLSTLTTNICGMDRDIKNQNNT